MLESCYPEYCFGEAKIYVHFILFEVNYASNGPPYEQLVYNYKPGRF